jgi:hypothetical protein
MLCFHFKLWTNWLIFKGLFNVSSPHCSSFCYSLQSPTVILWRTLWREDGSVIYCCCLALPTQSHSCLSPRDSRRYFIVLIFKTPAIWRARYPYLYPPGTEWPSYTPGHCVPFQSPLTTRMATVEVFQPSSTRMSEYSLIFQQVQVWNEHICLVYP